MSDKTNGKGAVLTVLSVVQASAPCLHDVDDARVKMIRLFQNAGFGKLRYVSGRTHGETISSRSILLEYEPKVPSQKQGFRMLQMNGESGYSIIETGYLLEDPKRPDYGGYFMINLNGKAVAEWEINCRDPYPKELEFYKRAIVNGRPTPLVEIQTEAPTPRVIAPVALPGVNGVATNGALPKGAVPLTPPLQAVHVPVNRIRPNKSQPRQDFNKAELHKLGQAMLQDGQNEAAEVIAVEGDPDADYELVKGERRWRAAQLVGIETLLVIIQSKDKVPNKDAQFVRCFVADSNRLGYNKFEMVQSILKLKGMGKSPKQIAFMAGKKVAWVYAYLEMECLHLDLLRLLNSSLPRKEQISFDVAGELARLPDKEKQVSLYKEISKIKSHSLQVAEVKRQVSALLPKQVGRRKFKPADAYRNLEAMIPRLAAEAIKSDKFTDEAIASLVVHRQKEEVNVLVSHLNDALEKFQDLKNRLERISANSTIKS